MAVAVDAVTFSTSSGSPTKAHTCTGSNLALYVLIAERFNTAVTGVTYAGVALTRIQQLNDGNVETTNIYRLVAPATGTNNVVISQSASHDLCYTIVSLTGVDQSTPEGTIVSGVGNSTAPTHTASAATDDLVIDLVAWYKSGTQTATVGSGQTERSNQSLGTIGGAVSTEPGAASVVMDWTLSGATNWNHAAVPVKAAAAAPPATGPRDLLLLGAG